MRKLFLLLCLSGMLVVQLFAQDSHTISFEVSDVTLPSISMIADGKSFVFNGLALGAVANFGAQNCQ